MASARKIRVGAVDAPRPLPLLAAAAALLASCGDGAAAGGRAATWTPGPAVARVAAPLSGAALVAGPRDDGALAFDEVSLESGFYDLAAGWGLSWCDVDVDGLPDLFVSDHMHYPSALYLNRGGLRLERAASELGHLAGLDDHLGVWADVDDDGDPDLYTTSGVYLPDRLLRNLGGGRFEEASADYGLERGAQGRGRSCVWSDLTGDGRLDLLVLDLFSPDLFYLREPGGGFREEALAAGLYNSFGKEGAAVGDLDGDGDQDVYVPVHQGAVRNLLFLNRGDGTFVERSKEAGIDLIGSSRSAALGDYDGDGRLDLYVARGDLRGDVLFRNRGDGAFEDATRGAGIALAGRGLRNAGFCDFDNDGWLDLYVSCGGPHDEPDVPNALLRNRGDGTFEDVTDSAGVAAVAPGNSASMAFADFDRDGYQDIALTRGAGARAISGPQLLFRNRGLRHGAHDGHWLLVHPRGGPGNREGFGARVRTRLEDGRELVRESPGARVMAQDEAPVHFGLAGQGSAREVAVRWPDGAQARMQGVPADSVVVVEGAPARLVGSHPAALLGQVPTFDLAAALARAAALAPGAAPVPDAVELAARTDDVLAYALARELGAQARAQVGESELRAAWERLRPDLEQPALYYVEQVAVGTFTSAAAQPPLEHATATAIADGLRAGRDALELARGYGVRAWARVAKTVGDDLGGDALRGYVESGWLSRAMLVERCGERYADAIIALPAGGVLGPVERREGRDLQDPSDVWPLLRVFRLVARAEPLPAERARYESQLRAYAVSSALRAALEAALGGEREPGARSRAFFGAVPYEIGPLAAAARARQMERRPDVRAALERAAAEAALDLRARRAVERVSVPADEVRARVALRRGAWRLPVRAAGTVLTFPRVEDARAAQVQLVAGATLAQVIEDLSIAAVTDVRARGRKMHWARVVVDRSLWTRMARGVSFNQLLALAPGTATPVARSPEGALVFVLDEVLPAEALAARTAAARALQELRREREDELLAALLWSRRER